MGTRSTIKFYPEGGEEPILSIYTQYDGYITGVGHDLANFLKDITVVNGFGANPVMGEIANGMGCLAAQYVAKAKDAVGNVYITSSDDEQEYNYKVMLVDGKLIIEETETGFRGTPEELLTYEQPIEDHELY